MTDPKVVRGKGGRFIAVRCTDPNCDGVLVAEDGDWRCNGLTHTTDDGELEACPRWEEGVSPTPPAAGEGDDDPPHPSRTALVLGSTRLLRTLRCTRRAGAYATTYTPLSGARIVGSARPGRKVPQMKIEHLEYKTTTQTVKVIEWCIPARNPQGEHVKLYIATTLPGAATPKVMADVMRGAQKHLDQNLKQWKAQGFTFDE